MPYEILEQGIGYVVVKQGTHQIVGRHKTLAEARAQLRALYTDTATEYEIRPADGRHHVVRQGDHVLMGTHSTRAEADAHMSALKAGTASKTTTHVDIIRETEGTFEILDWFSRSVVATLTDSNAAHTVVEIMMHNGQITDAEFSAEQMASLGKAGKAFRNGNGEWSYPTPTASYVHKAMAAFGRSSPGDRVRLKAYLKRRATAEGLSKEEIARIDGYKSA